MSVYIPYSEPLSEEERHHRRHCRDCVWPRELTQCFMSAVLRLKTISREVLRKSEGFTGAVLDMNVQFSYPNVEKTDASAPSAVKWASLLYLEATTVIVQACDSPRNMNEMIQATVSSTVEENARSFPKRDASPASYLRVIRASICSDDIMDGDLLLLYRSKWKRCGLAIAVGYDPKYNDSECCEEKREGSKYVTLMVSHVAPEDADETEDGGSWLHPTWLADGNNFRVLKLLNLVSTLRQVRAVDGAFSCPPRWLFRSTMGPNAGPPPEGDTQLPHGMKAEMWSAMLQEVNSEQARIVKWVCDVGVRNVWFQESRREDGAVILIVHGPPGTGKTKTLEYTVASILSNALMRKSYGIITPGASLYLMTGLITAKEKEDMDLRTSGLRCKLLLTAPSNCGVLEALRRIDKGLMRDDGTVGKMAAINIVLIGKWSDSDMENMDEKTRILMKKYHIDTAVQEKRAKANHRRRMTTDALRMEVLVEATIIVCTLAFAGGPLLTKACFNVKFKINIVIVDEASQATEPETMIIMRFKPDFVAFFGDHLQLRPTVISNNAALGVSLFERFLTSDYPNVMLRKQYRMDAEISAFPSAHFYNNLLKNSESVASRSPTDFHSQGEGLFGPLVLHQVSGIEEIKQKSRLNIAEARYVVGLYKKFLKQYPEAAKTMSVGIIAPYSQMRSKIQSLLNLKFSKKDLSRVSVSTVDGFQGREEDIIIFCCVRSNSKNGGNSFSSLDFVGDRNRMNVALTRAKRSLWVIGNFNYLKRNKDWTALAEYAESNELIRTNVSVESMES